MMTDLSGTAPDTSPGRPGFSRVWHLDRLADRFAAAIIAWRAASDRATDSRTVITVDEDHFFVRRDQDSGDATPVSTPVALPNFAGTVLREATGSGRHDRRRLTLRLLPSRAVTAELLLPRAEPALIQAILRNKIERLSPWPPSDVLFGHQVRDTTDAGRIAVRVAIAARADIDGLVAALAKAGVVPDVIDVGCGVGDTASIVLDDHLAADTRLLARRLASLFMATVIGLSLVAGALLAGLWWMSSSLAEAQSKLAIDMVAKSSGRRSLTVDDVIARKLQEPSALAVVDRLSAVLPDDIWLSNVKWASPRLTLRGQGRRIPAAAEVLQGDKAFAGVRFAAPTVRRAGGQVEEFSISLEVTARMGDAQ